MKGPVVAALLAVLAASCGGDGGDAILEVAPPKSFSDARMYFVREGSLWPALRKVAVLEADDLPAEALAELLHGPTGQEEADFDFATTIPEGIEIDELLIENGVARIDFSAELPPEALGQVVYTLTQFPTVQSVDLAEGAYSLTNYDRADFEEQTPAILVESPLAFEEVASPLRVTGTANTFEATFHYELLDSDRNVIDQNFVTATSGTGTRGTFDFTTGEFDDIATLVVFERSAKDGSRINVVEIPLRMTR